MRKIGFITLILVSFFACNNKNIHTNKPTITVSIVPQQFFVHQIADTLFDVNVIVPTGSSPATYEPTPKQMMSLSKSDIYFRIGHIGFEKAWIDKIKSVNKKLKIIDTSEGIKLIFDDNHSHNHNDNHKGANPHIWLSPPLVKQQAKTIANKIIKYYPQYLPLIQANLKVFLHKIDSVDKKINDNLENIEERSFIVFHPVWSYFAQRYKLHQVAIENNGKEASIKRMIEIVDFAKNNNIKNILVQKEFDTNQAQSIANEIKGNVLIMNPLGYNWFATMSQINSFFAKQKVK